MDCKHTAMTNSLRIAKPLLVVVLLLSQPLFAKTLRLGLSINMSGANAHYALDFINGIDAFITAENAKERFGKYKLELVVMDDFGEKERVYANAKRLLKHKNVLALFTEQDLSDVPKLISLARQYKTLLLSSAVTEQEFSHKQLEYLGLLTNPPKQILEPAYGLITQAQHIYLLSNSQVPTQKWLTSVQQKTTRPVELLGPTQLDTTKPPEHSLFIVHSDYLQAVQPILNILKSNANARVLVLPQAATTLIANALSHKLSEQELQRLYYLSTVPLHLANLPLLSRFFSDMQSYNLHATASHQAFKGYFLGYMAAESIHQSIKRIETDSVLDVVTLPFQVLDQVVGWVKNAGSDMSTSEVADTFGQLKNLNVGLHRPITIGKRRIILGESWLTRANKQTEFVEVLPPTEELF